VAGENSTQQYEKYLGLPVFIGRSKVKYFYCLEGKIWAKINGWKDKF
jgi:hypothetical protein